MSLDALYQTNHEIERQNKASKTRDLGMKRKK